MENKQEQTPEPEGLDIQGIALSDYPIESLTIRTETRALEDVIRRITKGYFILNPDFQRDFVWDEKKQSRLIESGLMRIPIPVFYFAERSDGKIVVVDGLQRLTTFKRFFDNEFKLKIYDKENSKKKAHPLNGCRFKDLAPKYKNRLSDIQLVLHLIDSTVPEEARLDIFERVNNGAELTRQQMRNALYCGPATQWLKEKSESKLFQEATGSSLDSKTMRDREVLNRFCAFWLLPVNSYKNMDEFLGEVLTIMNGMSDDEYTKLNEAFELSMTNNLNIFGEFAFRKHDPEMKSKNRLNASLFDVFSQFMADCPLDFAKENAERIRNVFFRLMANSDFNNAITRATNGPNAVKTRFEMALIFFEEEKLLE